jgi:hypothetical protein
LADPSHYFERLVGSDELKLRVGDSRLLAALSPSEQVITVERVDYRRRVYRRYTSTRRFFLGLEPTEGSDTPDTQIKK